MLTPSNTSQTFQLNTPSAGVGEFKPLRAWKGLTQTKSIISNFTFERAEQCRVLAYSWVLLLPERKRRLTLEGNGAPATLGHVLREPGPQRRSPPGLCASQSRGVRPATRRPLPASRDGQARASRHASRSPRRSSASPPCARRSRLPVPPGGQQGLAQVLTQLPQRGLRFWHL